MTGLLIKLVIFLVIAAAIYLGLRRIWRDWRGEFRRIDKARHERDLRERARPDVVTLRRDKDGRYRPPEE